MISDAGKSAGITPQDTSVALDMSVGESQHEVACIKSWQEAGIKTLPGAYLARSDAGGYNVGSPYIRLVLVHDDKLLEPALEKIAKTL